MRVVILGSAEIKNYEKISRFINPEDFIIACDGGLNHVEKLGLSPSAEIIQLPCEKDDTDVFFAVKEALRRGFTDFVLIGVIGQRFDHSLVNISVLLYLQKNGATGVIYDDYSKMQLVVADAKPTFIPNTYSYFSLMTLEKEAVGVTIKNAKYPLENATIENSYQLGVSNEVIPGQQAEVSLKTGSLLLIQVW